MFKAWGLRDRGKDIIGGSRGDLAFNTLTDFQTVTHPDYRGRVLTRLNVQELPDGFTIQGQLGLISDRNFLEQYYLNEFYNEYNQDTCLYVKQQQDNWAWTVLGHVRLARLGHGDRVAAEGRRLSARPVALRPASPTTPTPAPVTPSSQPVRRPAAAGVARPTSHVDTGRLRPDGRS